MKELFAIELRDYSVIVVLRSGDYHHEITYKDSQPIREWAEEHLASPLHFGADWFMLRKWIEVFFPSKEDALLFYVRFK